MLDTGACGADIMLHSRAMKEMGLDSSFGAEKGSSASRCVVFCQQVCKGSSASRCVEHPCKMNKSWPTLRLDFALTA